MVPHMVARDLAYSLRCIRRSVGQSLLIVLCLGIAMGVSTSVFSVADALFFKPWQVFDPARVKVLDRALPYDEFNALRNRATASTSLAGFIDLPALRNGQRINVEAVTTNYFSVAGASIRGGFDSYQPAAVENSIPVLISQTFWNQQFNSDPNVIGRGFQVNRIVRDGPPVDFTVAGIVQDGFDGTNAVERTAFWVSLERSDAVKALGSSPNSVEVTAFCRFDRGASSDLASRELSTMAAAYRAEHGAGPTDLRFTGTSRYDRNGIAGETRRMWESLVIGVIFLSVIVCANVANLLLARGFARRGDTALRLALGASRTRLVQQQLTETLILAVAAASVGLSIGLWLPGALGGHAIQLIAPDLDGLFRIHVGLDPRLFAWAVGLTILTTAIFGVVPALATTRIEPGEVMKESLGASRRALSAGLLAYQILVSVCALSIAAVLLRSAPVTEARHLLQRFGSVTAITVAPVTSPYRSAAPRSMAAVFASVSEVVGPANVGGLTNAPATGRAQILGLTAEAFSMLEIGTLSHETLNTPNQVVINRACADRVWGRKSAVGQRMPDIPGVSEQAVIGKTVAAVVSDGFINPVIYRPISPSEARVLIVRATADQISAALERAQRTVPTVKITATSGRRWLASAAGPATVTAWITLGFGGIGLALGTLGLFSLLEYTVQQRLRELGIRRALGARSAHIVAAILQPVASPIGKGALVGVAAAVAGAIVMKRADLPNGLRRGDAVAYIAVLSVVGLALIAAGVRPAIRAIAAEPAITLREN